MSGLIEFVHPVFSNWRLPEGTESAAAESQVQEVAKRHLGLGEQVGHENSLRLIASYLDPTDIEKLKSVTKSPLEKSLLTDEQARIRKKGVVRSIRRALPAEEFGDIEAVKARAPWPIELCHFLATSFGQNQVVVFPLPSRLRLDGRIVPCTMANLDKLAKSKEGRPGIRCIYGPIRDGETPSEESEIQWIVMTKTIVPGTRGLTYLDQVDKIREWASNLPERQEFAMPEAREALLALLWHWEATPNHECLLSDNPWTYTRCETQYQGYRLVVGDFAPSGVHVDGDDDVVDEILGASASKKYS